jgi:hypothetical protein
MRKLNSALAGQDKGQASAILAFILERDLHPSDQFKFGSMRVKLLLEMGAARDAAMRALELAEASKVN